MCLQSDDVVHKLSTLGPQSLCCFLGFTLFSREEKLLVWPFVAVYGRHVAVLVVLLVFSPPGGPLLVVGLNIEVCEEGNQRNHVSNL